MRVLPLLLVLAACKKQEELPVGDGLFAEGCPAEGASLARQIGVDAKLPGDAAVGTRGDFLLANEQVAVVITEADKGSTYWYYGGIIADALAMNGCAPAAEDKLDEMALVIGDLNFLNINDSVLRGFRAEQVEVLADGSDGGAAIVRATGTDDMHWLVDNELQKAAVMDGDTRVAGRGFGVDIVVDYILAPGSSVVEIEMTFANPADAQADVELLSAFLVQYGITLDRHRFPTNAINLGGLTIESGVPWVVASDGAGAYAYAPEEGNLGFLYFSGVNVAVDLDTATFEPIALDPGDDTRRTSFLAIGATDGPSATRHLAAVNPEPVRDLTYALHEVRGVVRDAAGTAVPGARVRLEADAGDGPGVLDEAWADAEGAFVMTVPAWNEQTWAYGLSVVADGRDFVEAVAIEPTVGTVDLAVGPSGLLEVSVTGDDGPLPARVQLRRGDGQRATVWVNGEGSQPLAPGTWEYTVTRGYEYSVATGTVVIPEDGAGTVEASLSHVIDTTGWMSIDTHVHSEYSPDSRVPSKTQLLHGAAHGVDVVLHTEHEHIVDQLANDVEAGLGDHVNNLLGQEVTATMPEHMTMFPVASPDDTVRGGFIPWYAKDIGGIYALMHERTDGGINILNHPHYMDAIRWDFVAGAPQMTDPTVLGWDASGEVWSWDFEGIEVMNGHGVIFDGEGGNARFEKWQSLLNAGHRIVPAGCSDDHGGDQTGFPRTYFASSTDVPAELDASEVVQSYKDGAIMVSSGAFARVDINGAGPGDEVVGSGALSLNVHVEAIPEIDVTHALVFVNCDEVARLEVSDPAAIVKLDEAVTVDITADSQVTVAAFGTGRYPDGLPNFNPTGVPRVMTSAIFVDAEGDGWTAPGGRVCAYDVR
ncbi:MAG: hypothetical protein EP330_19970 [Deltaproteobacteria bacterium]|nr:MAG: hypothetical protein EP330_19970 [Deltaproteobacteria bacterium]